MAAPVAAHEPDKPGSLPAGVCGLTFDEEFDHFQTSPDGSVGWMTAYPYAGRSARALPDNGEDEFYSDSSVGAHPFSVRDGILTITADRAAPGSNPYGFPYTSGLITTFKSFAQTYGYFEIRARLPAGRGLWPAFWLLGDSVVYDSELDIFEMLGHEPTKLHATTHGKVAGKWQALGQTLTVADMTADFHTYGADWEPTTTTFYMDGRAIATAPTPPAMNKPMYILLNLAVGRTKSWPGAPDAGTRFPARYQIAWVRVYATRSTSGITGTAARPAGACH
jgi:beta-glucanase (GH16 family)